MQQWFEILKLEKAENCNVILKGWSYPLYQKINNMIEFTEALDDRLTNRQKYIGVSQHNNKLNEKIKEIKIEREVMREEWNKEKEEEEDREKEAQSKRKYQSKEWWDSHFGVRHVEYSREDDWQKSVKTLMDLESKIKKPKFNKHSSINRIAILRDISQLDNSQYIIDEAKKIDINLQDPSILRHFLVEMQTSFNWDMEIFENIKGLLPQEATGSEGDVDLTPKIKQVIQMFKHMNKPITQESVLDELGLDEQTWKEEYDKLLRE